MAAPNIVSVTSIVGKTTDIKPANTTPNVLLSNSAASGKVFKVNMLMAANIDSTSTYAVTVARNSASDGSGTTKELAKLVPVPVNSSLVVIDKSTSFYLQENESIVVTTSVADKIVFTISYEEIS